MNQKTHLTGGRDLLFRPLPSNIESALKELSSTNYGKDFAKQMRNACKQLSQLIAWMWHPDDILSDKINKKDAKNLKKAFDGILKYQAFNNNKDGSEAIENLLLGKNQDIPSYVYNGEIPDHLTLENIYDDLMIPENNEGDENYENTYAFNKQYLKIFYTEVVVDSFDGSVSFDFFGTENPTEKTKFIVIIAYPPRPTLDELTVSKEELRDWAKDYDGGYYPPNYNPYIPISAST